MTQIVLAAAEMSGLSVAACSGVSPVLRSVGFETISVQNFEFSFVPSATARKSQAMGRYVEEKLLPNYPELLRKLLQPQGITEGELQRLTK